MDKLNKQFDDFQMVMANEIDLMIPEKTEP